MGDKVPKVTWTGIRQAPALRELRQRGDMNFCHLTGAVTGGSTGCYGDTRVLPMEQVVEGSGQEGPVGRASRAGLKERVRVHIQTSVCSRVCALVTYGWLVRFSAGHQPPPSSGNERYSLRLFVPRPVPSAAPPFPTASTGTDMWPRPANQSAASVSPRNRFGSSQSRPSLGFFCWSWWEKLPLAFPGGVQLEVEAWGSPSWLHGACPGVVGETEAIFAERSRDGNER